MERATTCSLIRKMPAPPMANGSNMSALSALGGGALRDDAQAL